MVAYLESSPDDSPWNVPDLEAWETILPGRVFGRGRVRCHWNSLSLSPDLFDRVVLNVPLTAATTQRLMRQLEYKNIPWFFWGEILLAHTGIRRLVQSILAAPLSRSAGIVAIGKRAADDYHNRFPDTCIFNIPYACDLDPFAIAASQRLTSKACRFLFAGQMIERKGVDVLLESFDSLIAQGIDVTLDLLGREGSLPIWLEALPEITRNRIKYLGFKQPSELPEVFARSDVFVIPSRHDGWGVVVNQALGAGLPVISTTSVGAGTELLSDGKAGILIPPDDPDALAVAMKDLACNETLRTLMSKETLEIVLQISPKAAAEKWMEVLKSVHKENQCN